MSNFSIKIKRVLAREVLDSRGFPTVEVELFADDPQNPDHEIMGRAIVPSGASTGEHEAIELRDGDRKRYLGKGVIQAVANVHQKIAPAIIDREFTRQTLLDDLLIEIDGTKNKSNLGANAILAVSLAFARLYAAAHRIAEYEMISNLFGSTGKTLPVPMMNIINGGAHADNGLDIQEFMIVPLGFNRFSDALRAGSEIFHHLKIILKHKNLSTGVGDEGGFAPAFEGEHPHEQAITAIIQAISDAGYKAGKDVFLALDAASSEFVEESRTTGDYQYKLEGQRRTAREMIDVYTKWLETYPIISLEDGLAENDWKGWEQLTREIGTRCQLVGDDLFVTNSEFLTKGIESKTANSILIKLNQIGTLTETLETMRLAQQANYTSVTSHRSGESEDTFIADLAVGTECGQIKTGSLCRSDRIAKYNQLLRIEEKLGKNAQYAGQSAFRGLSF